MHSQYMEISFKGRNNGFLNMLNVMKKKASQLQRQRDSEASPGITNESSSSSSLSSTTTTAESSYGAAGAGEGGGGPIYRSIIKKLSMLKPVELQVEDESHKHAGHAGTALLKAYCHLSLTRSGTGVRESGNRGGETHFNVRVVAACFESLSLVQRHKMVYTLLAAEMNQGGGPIHALSIKAISPSELNK